MMKNNGLDLFTALKKCIVKTCFEFQKLKEEVIMTVLSNSWLLQDANLYENYTKLQEMIKISDKHLTSIIKETKYIENNSVPFSADDIICEYNFIRENIELETYYLYNMLIYMIAVVDFSLKQEEIKKIQQHYLETDIFCYDNMRANNEQLKILKKERGDYFE